MKKHHSYKKKRVFTGWFRKITVFKQEEFFCF